MKQIIQILFFCSLGQYIIAQNQPGLHVDENQTVLFGADTTSVGFKTMWIPSKAAFRSGKMTSAWNYSAIGNLSAAFGSDTQAQGNYSFATGLGTTANSFAEFSIGRYSLGGGSITSWNNNASDVVFEIGNGVSPGSQSNLLTVQKNGNMKIGDMTDATEIISEKLIVDGGIVLGDAVDNTPAAGTIRWNAANDEFEGWDGNEWVKFGRNKQKVRYYNAADLVFEEGNGEFEFKFFAPEEGAFIDGGNASRQVFFPLSLEAGTIIDSIKVKVYDNDPTRNLLVRLRYETMTNLGTSGTVISSGASTTHQVLNFSTSSLNNVTDGARYIYISPIISPAATNWGTGDLKFTVMKVYYREP